MAFTKAPDSPQYTGPIAPPRSPTNKKPWVKEAKETPGEWDEKNDTGISVPTKFTELVKFTLFPKKIIPVAAKEIVKSKETDKAALLFERQWNPDISEPERTPVREEIEKIIVFSLDNCCQQNSNFTLDDLLKKPIAEGACEKAPDISIKDYLNRFVKYGDISEEALIHAFYYLNQMIKRGFILNYFNIHRILAVAIAVSAKYIDDKPYTNKRFSAIAGLKIPLETLMKQRAKNPSVSLNPYQQLKDLEVEFLAYFNFQLYVHPDSYKLFTIEIEEAIKKYLVTDNTSSAQPKALKNS